MKVVLILILAALLSACSSGKPPIAAAPTTSTCTTQNALVACNMFNNSAGLPNSLSLVTAQLPTKGVTINAAFTLSGGATWTGVTVTPPPAWKLATIPNEPASQRVYTFTTASVGIVCSSFKFKWPADFMKKGVRMQAS